MLSVNTSVTVSEKDVQYYLFGFLRALDSEGGGVGAQKIKAPSWVLGACTQREAVGGDSPPGMLSVGSILAI
jgi:hypothetical protein